MEVPLCLCAQATAVAQPVTEAVLESWNPALVLALAEHRRRNLSREYHPPREVDQSEYAETYRHEQQDYSKIEFSQGADDRVRKETRTDCSSP